MLSETEAENLNTKEEKSDMKQSVKGIGVIKMKAAEWTSEIESFLNLVAYYCRLVHSLNTTTAPASHPFRKSKPDQYRLDFTDVRGSLMFQEILNLLTKHDFAEAFVF